MPTRRALLLAPLTFFLATAGWVLYLARTHADRLLGFVPDDAFYYFGIAEHLRQGFWFSFDGITRTNGFHPLWAAVITPVLWWAGHDFVPVLIVGAMLSAFAIAILARVIEHLWDGRTAEAFSWLMALNPALFALAVNGLETGLLLLASSVLLWLVFVRRVRTPRDSAYLGIATAAVFLSRTDGAILATLSWLVVLAEHRRERRPASQVLMIAGVTTGVLVAPWLIFNASVFGSIMQDSGRVFTALEGRYHEYHGSLDVLATRQWAILASGLKTLGRALGLGGTAGLVAVAATAAIWRRQLVSRNSSLSGNFRAGHPASRRCSSLKYVEYSRSSRLAIPAPRSGTSATNHCYGTLAGSRLQFVGVLIVYGAGILAAGAWRLVIREWYMAPIISVAMLLGAVAICRLPRRAWSLPVSLAVGLVLAGLGRDLMARGPFPDQHVEPNIIRVVQPRIPAGARVGVSDAGMWGWFAPFTVVNLDGFANSDVIPAIRRGALLDYLREHEIRIFFLGRSWWRQPWLMGPESGLLYDDTVIEEAGRRPDGTAVVMSRLLETNAEVVARYGRETIAAGDVDFGRWLGDGWARPLDGPGEVWSIAPSSTLYLPLPATGEATVTLWLNAIVNPEGRCRVRVVANGRDTGSLEVTNSTAHRPYTITVGPSSALVTSVRLDYDRTWNPKAMGLSADTRNLAVSIVRIDTKGPAAR